MKNFTDRTPQDVGRRKIIHADGAEEFVTVEMADNPTVEGTPINRAAMLAVQGFEETTTTFNNDGSITQTNADGDVLTTVFLANGNIQATFTGSDDSSVVKTTTFNDDGSIEEVLS